MDGASIQLVNSAPPYNVNVEPASTSADTGGQRPGKRHTPTKAMSKGRQRGPSQRVQLPDRYNVASLLNVFGSVVTVIDKGGAPYRRSAQNSINS